MPLSNQEGFGLCFNNNALNIGERVKATTPDTKTEPAKAKANSVNKRPVRPGVKANGAYTATKVRVMATIAKPTSLEPFKAA